TMGHCDDESYIYTDKGAGNIGDFEWLIKLAVTDVDAGDGSTRQLGILLGATTVHGDYSTFPSDDCVFVELYQQTDNDDKFRVFLRENVNGGVTFNTETGTLFSAGTPYWITFSRVGTVSFIEVYDDVDRTSLVDSVTDNAASAQTYRYVQVGGAPSSGTDCTDDWSGTIEDLDLQEIEDGVQSLVAGFFVQMPFEDLLGTFTALQPIYSITGITKDKAGNRLANCEIALFRTDPGNPPTYTFIEAGTSNGNGDY
ncbi:unnamed protein product, partial [marine sediment metagenome]